MQKDKSKGRFFILAGVLLIFAAIALVVWNVYWDSQGGKAAEKVVEQLNQEIPKPENDGDSEYMPKISDETSDEESETAFDLDGKKYIGIISVPKINLELPVMNEWSYANLDIAPCRYSGTALGGDLIIAAHNYTSFFDRIDELNSGDKILFTECSGKIRTYEVVASELIGGTDVVGMERDSENWDLTLFTCTWSGWSRITVRAAEI